ncbi:MAG: hypothetical protein WCY61_06285 [Sphaerochaeta sp.]
MKRIVTTLIILTITALLFSAAIGDSVVLYLHGYIPERTEFFTTEDGVFEYTTNAYNFTTVVEEVGSTRLLNVIAN